MPKISLLSGMQVNEEKGERAEVARTHMEEVTKGKVNSMGKTEIKEFTPKIKCFLCDGPHLAQDCSKRKVFSAMIEEREQEHEAHMGSI